MQRHVSDKVVALLLLKIKNNVEGEFNTYRIFNWNKRQR
jgi:hypothetical protein